MLDNESVFNRGIFNGVVKTDIRKAQDVIRLLSDDLIINILDTFNNTSSAVLLLKFKLSQLTKILLMLVNPTQEKIKYQHGVSRVAGILSAKNSKNIPIISKEVAVKFLVKLIKSGRRKTAVEIFKLLSADKKVFAKPYLEKAIKESSDIKPKQVPSKK